jgi:fimbrial isopeptide formation D2 family protein/LPXTG-motif cell wall-anchored protein
MKLFKKLLSYIIAFTMVLSLATLLGGNVYAAETTYKLTLTGTAKGHTYEAYQVFTGDLSTDDGKKVLSNVKWGTGTTYTGTESAADVAKALGNRTMTIADLQSKLTLTKPVKTVESSKDSTTTVIDGLVAGYYLVKDQDGTQTGKSDAYTKFIVQVVGDTEASIKSNVPTVVKKVQDINDSTGETSGWQDSADYDIGDDVPYQITGTMPDDIADYTTYKYEFSDTMSKGLTYTANTATIKIGDKDVTGSFQEVVTKNTDDDPTVVTWTCNNLKGIDGVTLDKDTKVVVTYTAKLNENATIGAAGNPNTVNLTYSNNPNNSGKGETGKTPDDKNIVFTYKTVVNKFDQDGTTRLKGAGFTLQKKYKKNDGTFEYKVVKTFTAGEETTFEFTGLDDGAYKLIESTTPAGYNTITPIEFTISATHNDGDEPTLASLSGNATTGEATFTVDKTTGSLTTDVINKKGSTLPSTGGMGTTLLYVAGGILVACAAAYVVLNKKRA